MPHYHQDDFTRVISQYLKFKKRDINLTRGYCHGLTLFWLYKMSEGKEEWFYALYDRMVHWKGKNFDSLEMDIEKLLSHIEWLQNPHDYVKNIQQLDTDKLLEMPKDLAFSFLFDHNTLEKTLDKVLPKSEMVCLSGPNHSIGVFRRGNQYHIYNPNYPYVRPKIVNNLKDLKPEIITYLFKNCHLSSEKLALHINVINNKNGRENKELNSDMFNDLLKSTKMSDSNVERTNNLFLACESGNLELVKKLVMYGAKINSTCQEDRTALSIATSQNCIPVVDYLLNNGAQPDLANRDESSPLHYAAHYGYVETAELLLKKGANPLKVNLLDCTPLAESLSGYHWDTAAIILAYVFDAKKIPHADLREMRQNPEFMLPSITKLISLLPSADKKRLCNTVKHIYKISLENILEEKPARLLSSSTQKLFNAKNRRERQPQLADPGGNKIKLG